MSLEQVKNSPLANGEHHQIKGQSRRKSFAARLRLYVMVRDQLQMAILSNIRKPLTTRALARTLSIDKIVEMGSIQAETVPWKI